MAHDSVNYIIGYGSLMQASSRIRTDPHAQQAYPVEVKGFERVWGFMADITRLRF